MEKLSKMASTSTVNKFGITPYGGTGDFNSWLFRLKVALEENECIELISEKDASKIKNFNKKSAKAKSVIIQSVADNVLEIVSECETAHEMIEKLQERYNRKSLSETILLKRQLINLKFVESKPLNDHLEEFNKLVKQLSMLNIKHSEKELICNLLLTMPKSYDNIVTSIETLVSHQEISLDFVINRLLNEELKRKSSRGNDKVESEKMHQSFVTFQYKCYKCGKQGHKRNECRSNGVMSHGNHQVKCFKCGKMGHKSNVCTARYVAPPGHSRNIGQGISNTRGNHGNSRSMSNIASNVLSPQGNSNNISHAASNVSGTGSMDDDICLLTEEEPMSPVEHSCTTEFIIDSGCTDHICNNLKYFHEFVFLNKPIKIAVAKNGEYMVATAMGNIKCKILVNNSFVNCTLKNVLYVQELKQNLLSVKKLEQVGHTLVFECGKVSIYLQDKLIAEGVRETLYKLRLYFDTTSECHANHCEENIKLWHARLGHLGEANLKKLVKKNLVNGISSNIVNENLGLCENCIEGKQCKLPFGSRTKATRVLEIIHTDVCGPLNPISYDGSKYFVTFMDEFTHFVMVYCIKSKDEVLCKFKDYVNLVHNKFNVRVHKLRCDNGGEFSSHEFKQFCSSEGIVLDYTTVYTPEQNGKSERLNRTLVEKMRSMISESGVPKTFWSEILYTATYLLNRSPTDYLGDKTPAEMWYDLKPNLSNLRVFGCTAYAHVPNELRLKLDSKSEKCVMLGYSLTGYKLWNLSKNKIVISRNVIFNEKELYFKCQQEKSVESEETEEDETPEKEGVNIESEERVRKPPKRFDDYEMYLAYNACSFIDNVPLSYNDAMKRNNKVAWEKAIKRELLSIEDNGTWEVVDIGTVSDKKSILSSKWVFAFKDFEENENKFKARLVVRGFQQSDNTFNYDEIFSPVAKMSTIRTLLSVGNEKGHRFDQLDVKTAFLNGTLSENVFMYPPEGLDLGKGKVLKLKKSLYGLKQSAKCWNDAFNNFVLNIGFERSNNDFCLYKMKKDGKFIYLILYVDDIILSSEDDDLIDWVKSQLMNQFKMKDKGPLSHFLGLEINYDRKNGILKINQSKYAEKILLKFNMSECKTNSIPMNPQLDLTDQSCDLSKPYRELLGSLMYLMLGSRPDLCYCIHFFSRYQNCYTVELWMYLKNVLKYVKGTLNLGLLYRRSDNCDSKLKCFVDSDWASDKSDRKSVSGYLFKLNENLLMWSTKKQMCVALSTTESELVAMCTALTDGLWLKNLLSDLNIDMPMLVVYEDNQGCISIIKNPGNNRRVKHIDIKYQFICEKVCNHEIEIKYVDSKNQLADILTKGLSKHQFCKLRELIGLQTI